MSFFSETKNLGAVMMIIAALQMVSGLINIVFPFVDEALKADLSFYLVCGIGLIICGLLLFACGNKVYKGQLAAKIDILATYVRVIGLVTIIDGVFAAVASMTIGAGLASAIISAIVSIIIGLIILWIGSKINDGKQTIGDKVIWIILLLAFGICLIAAIISLFLSLFSLVSIIQAVASILLYIFMLALLFDPSVKSEMNM